jgi:pyridoxine 5-phosphate synthase
MVTRLSVNINKVALIRNARGENLPDLVKVAADCEAFGAQGITVHPRPDERHIRFSDLVPLKRVVQTEFNVEGYPSQNWLDHVKQVRPHQCTLVPDPPNALTSSSGWDTVKHQDKLRDIISDLKSYNIRTSIFLNPDPAMVDGAAACGADRIELYTGEFARAFAEDPERAVKMHIETAVAANTVGLGVNAGHDLNLRNLTYYLKKVPGILEVSIGHALICDALYFGLENTIQMYRYRIDKAFE